MQGAGRLTLRVAQARQCVKRPIQIGRTVNEYEVDFGHQEMTALLPVRILSVFVLFLALFRFLRRCLNRTGITRNVKRPTLTTASGKQDEEQHAKRSGK